MLQLERDYVCRSTVNSSKTGSSLSFTRLPSPLSLTHGGGGVDAENKVPFVSNEELTDVFTFKTNNGAKGVIACFAIHLESRRILVVSVHSSSYVFSKYSSNIKCLVCLLTTDKI